MDNDRDNGSAFDQDAFDRLRPDEPAGDETQGLRPEAGEATRLDLADLRRKAEEYDALMDRYKRAAADYQNAQKRLQKQAEERSAFAIEGFARELLVVVDDLARAIQAAEEHETIEAILDGLKIVENHLYGVLERHGVTPVKMEAGTLFDPAYHEAMSVVKTDKHEPNRVIEECRRGFLIHNRLLRPSRVIVSVPTTETKPEG